MRRYQNLAIADPAELCFGRRVMNQALTDGRDAALLYRNWLVESDAGFGPQAWVLTPESAITIARAIVKAATPLAAGRDAALSAVRLLREASSDGRLKIQPRELSWLDRIEKNVETIPENESDFIGEMIGCVDATKFVPADYDL